MSAPLPTISIVIPSFRAAATIARALDSLIAQNYPGLEIIVIDGASDGGTVDIIRRYETRLASWASEKDKSQAEALNKGFLRATGDLFGWLCADDALLPGTLHRMASFLAAHPEFDGVTGGSIRDLGAG